MVPKVFHTKTSAEYWHRAGSLVHTDPLGKRDAVIPQEVRIYAIGGAQHGPGNGIPGAAGSGQLPANPTDYRPLLRALLVSLTEWVAEGKTPPDSVYPTLRDGTLRGWTEAESGWKAVAGVRYPGVIQTPEVLDHGPGFLEHRRLTRLPPLRKGAYTVLVSALGPDNNERGMLLLPTVAVPLGTFTGWNLRSNRIGAPEELLSLSGAYIPFARTPAGRSPGDPRPTVEDLHGTRYSERYDAAVDSLIRRRFILEEDRTRLLDLGRRLWELTR
jgi:hypothetical protein